VKQFVLRGGYRTDDPRLDRLPSQNTRRLSLFPVANVLEDVPLRTKLHRRGPLLDQSPEKDYDGSGCVGFSNLNFLRSSPVRNPFIRVPLGKAMLEKSSAIYLYHEYQMIDEWAETHPGGEGGTSVDAAGKYMAKLGVYSNYWWITNGAEELARVLQNQPAIMGTWWTSGMDAADLNDTGIVSYDGRKRGGHAWLVDGVLVDESYQGTRYPLLFRGYQTWGQWGWHKNGTFWIPGEDMDQMLSDQGECMVPTEVAQV
jgi:hypothetical protein